MDKVTGPSVTTAPACRETRAALNLDLARAMGALDRASKAAERLAFMAGTEGDRHGGVLWYGRAGRLRVAAETAADLIR